MIKQLTRAGEVLYPNSITAAIKDESTGKSLDSVLSDLTFSKINMTDTTAVLKPNKHYIWGIVDNLNISLEEGDTTLQNKYSFEFKNPAEAITTLVLPNTIIWKNDVELDENYVPVMEPADVIKIEIIDNLAKLERFNPYIKICDPAVKTVLMERIPNDGIGILYRDAISQKSITYAWFQSNENITEFNELEKFIRITNFPNNGQNGIFKNCKSLKSLALPRYLSNCSKYMCYGCENLDKVKFALPITVIDNFAFTNCSSLTTIENLDFNRITDVNQQAFINCSSFSPELRSQSLIHIKEGAFSGSGIKGKLYLPNLETLIDRAFYGCNNLTEIESLGKITELGTYSSWSSDGWYGAFAKCNNLRKVNLPDGLITICARAFYRCNNLNEINFPDSIETIEESAFIGNINMNVEIPSTNNIKTIQAFAFEDSGICGKLNLPNLENIKDRAFRKSKITEIESLGKITELAKYESWKGDQLYGAFSDCTNLTKVNLPDGLITVGNSVFKNCSNLIEMNLPDSIETIEGSAFYNCSNWNINKRITSLVNIGEQAFMCTPNTDIVIDCPNLTSIGYNVFCDSGVISAKNLGNITTIPGYSNFSYQNGFHDSKKLKFVRLPSTITTICSEAFAYCSELDTVVIEAETPPSLGGSAFASSNSVLIYVPDNSIETYKTATNWNTWATRIRGISEFEPYVITSYKTISSNSNVQIETFHEGVKISPNYTIDNSSIASIDENGNLGFTEPGTVTVTAQHGDDIRSKSYTYAIPDYSVDKDFAPSTINDIEQIVNTNIKLFSNENTNWTLYVEVSNIDYTKMTTNGTAITCMDESGTPYPGFTIKRNSNGFSIHMDINENVRNTIYSDASALPFTIIRRRDNVLEYSLNGGKTYFIGIADINATITSYPNLSESTLIVGGYIKDGTLSRAFCGHIKAELFLR